MKVGDTNQHVFCSELNIYLLLSVFCLNILNDSKTFRGAIEVLKIDWLSWVRVTLLLSQWAEADNVITGAVELL